jgi:tRNA pseudouridine38-40 synthase
MRRVRLELAYDGTDFAGWQVQPGLRTVQGVVAGALSRLNGDRPVNLRGAGRTDAGVHALAQVADCAFDGVADDAALLHALTRMLPEDVRALSVDTAADAFDARRDARAKVYAYRLDRTRHGDPFARRFAWWRPGGLDRAAIEAALARLPGRRDWSGFTAASCEVEDRVRTLFEARYDEAEGAGRLTFAGEGFLTHMVRNVVGTVLEIGRGRFGPERVDEVLRTGDRALAGPTAPARGLFLESVLYDNAPPRREA